MGPQNDATSGFLLVEHRPKKGRPRKTGHTHANKKLPYLPKIKEGAFRPRNIVSLQHHPTTAFWTALWTLNMGKGSCWRVLVILLVDSNRGLARLLFEFLGPKGRSIKVSRHIAQHEPSSLVSWGNRTLWLLLLAPNSHRPG